MIVRFDPLQEGHLVLLKRWLAEPHVARWWQEPSDESELRNKYLVQLRARRIEPLVIVMNNRPIGFIQCYEACRIGGGWWEDTEPGVFGIDQFIGDPALIGQGIGSKVILEFVRVLAERPAVRAIIADPDPTNERAIRAYERVGFIRKGLIRTPGGAAMLMRLNLS